MELSCAKHDDANFLFDLAGVRPKLIKMNPKKNSGRVDWGCMSPERSEGVRCLDEGRQFKSSPAHRFCMHEKSCSSLMRSQKYGISIGMIRQKVYGC